MKKMKLFSILLIFALVACGAAKWQEHYDLGMKYLREGNYQEAILSFNKAIEIDDKQAVVYIGRGNAYIGLGEAEENLTKALADYEIAVSLDESNPEAYLGIADVYIRRGEYDKALEFLKEALLKTGENESISAKIAEMEGGEFKDSEDKVRRRNSYDADGKLSMYQILEYNADGRESKILTYQANGELIQYMVPEYDGNGRELKTLSYSNLSGNWELTFTQTNVYNADGKVIRSNFSSVDGESWYVAFEYDDAGELIRSNQYSADGKLSGYTIQEYNADGKWIRSNHYDADGTLKGYSE